MQAARSRSPEARNEQSAVDKKVNSKKPKQTPEIWERKR
jgi:hypothetical protein